MEPRLRKQLERVDERQACAQKEQASSFLWGLAAAGMAIVLLARQGVTTLQVIVVFSVAAALVMAARLWVGARRRDPLEVAREVERGRGDLDSSLLAAAELEPDLPDGRYGFLAKRLIDKVLLDARQNNWAEVVVPARRLGAARGVHAALAGLFLVLLALGLQNRGVAGATTGAGSTIAGVGPAEVTTEFAVDVQPGDAEVERGRGVLITAAFPLAHAPAEAALVVAMGDKDAELPMRRSLDDPIYALRLPAVTADTTYQVRWPGGATREYRLSVFDLPKLERSDLLLRFPSYAGMEDRLVEDTHRATVPEGTQVVFKLTLNKPVAEAWLRDRDGAFELPLSASPDGPRQVEGSLVLTSSSSLELDLVDADGRENATKQRFVLRASDNTRPSVALEGARDKVVSPIEELDLTVKLQDDYGLRRYGIGYRLGGNAETLLVLGEDAQGGVELTHRIAFEELAAEAKDLLAYYFWAEDLGSDGKLRRTTSDLFLAEVRPFEQIFREAEAQAAGQEQQQQQQDQQQQPQQQQGQQGAAQLVQLQKDILVATWNAVRAYADGAEGLAQDAEVLRDSQTRAREDVETLAGAAELLGVDGV
ncbi:MAG: hypothetical protein O2816_07520 [Planctomycetota bacterium]|nr:hypothetical protein [Planctomycetota bacterium]